MALRALSPEDLAASPTLFESFMGRMGRGRKTLGQLLAIYRERSPALDAVHDEDDTLRVERFMRDMAHERWSGGVVMRIGEFDGAVHVIDGIHRGIAYLACIENGMRPERLPALLLDC